MIIYDTKNPLPHPQEIQQALGIAKPLSVTIDKDIWRELQTVKQHGTHTLKIIITDAPPKGRFCIVSDMEPSYKLVNGLLYGEQSITVCGHYEICPLKNRASVCQCGSYMHIIRKSPECSVEQAFFKRSEEHVI